MKRYNSKDCSRYADQCRLVSYWTKKYNAALYVYRSVYIDSKSCDKIQKKEHVRVLHSLKQIIKESQRGLEMINGNYKIKKGGTLTLIDYYDKDTRMKVRVLNFE